MSDRPVRVLLDASAIVAFTRGSIDVGEVIAEVDDEHAAVGLPQLCLVDAEHAVADPARLDLLVTHRAASVLTDAADQWRGRSPRRTKSWAGSTRPRPLWRRST